MQLKELTLKELLALFDASTHDQISEYYGDPAIHYIVVFANHFQPDMGLLTVGPAQDCTSLEQAKRAIIDRKFAKFVIRCQHCPAEKKKNETVIGLVRPIDRGAHLEAVRTAASAEKDTAPHVAPAAAATAPANPEREAELAKREAALKTIEEELKQREDELVEREEYVTQSEESLIDKIQKQERRGAELEQQDENIKRKLEDLAKKEAALNAKIEEFKARHPDTPLS